MQPLTTHKMNHALSEGKISGTGFNTHRYKNMQLYFRS